MLFFLVGECLVLYDVHTYVEDNFGSFFLMCIRVCMYRRESFCFILTIYAHMYTLCPSNKYMLR